MSSAAGECDGPARSSSTRRLTEYDFGPQHPMSPVRVDLTMRLAEELGVTGRRLRMVPAPMADDDLIATVHDPRADRGGRAGWARSPAPGEERRGLGTDDNPVFARHAPGGGARGRRQRRGVPPGVDRRERCTAPTSPAACTTRCATGPAASASTTTSRSASSGCSTRAPSGSRTSTSTSTTATASSRSSGTTRGCSPSPCTRPGRCCSPAPASPRTPAARTREGTAVNVALPPGTADAGWLRAFHAVVPPLLREFAPDVLVTQHGCDSHAEDPLAHLMLTVDGQRAAYLALHDLAHEVVRRPLGGHRRRRLRAGRGGAAGLDPPAGDRRGPPARPGDRRRPEAWREHVARAPRRGRRPRRLTDGRDAGVPSTGRRATTRTPGWTGRSTPPGRAVFPLHGLDPLP